MGQSSSREAQTADSSGGTDENVSGVSLAPELEEQIVRDFNNEILQNEWNKVRAGVINRNQRLEDETALKMRRLEEERIARAAVREQRVGDLDAKIEHYDAMFADAATALEYDAAALSERYGAVKAKEDVTMDSTPLPCLGPRAHWIDCQKKYATDWRPCLAYMDALEKCVNGVILKRSEQSQ